MEFTPPSPMHGATLRDDLADAGVIPTDAYVRDGRLVLHGLDEAQRATVEAVLSAHPERAEAAAAAEATEAATAAAIRVQAAEAMAANRDDIATNSTFLANPSPTGAEIASQVRELSRQSTRQARELNALIRLALHRFDGSD